MNGIKGSYQLFTAMKLSIFYGKYVCISNLGSSCLNNASFTFANIHKAYRALTSLPYFPSFQSRLFFLDRFSIQVQEEEIFN